MKKIFTYVLLFSFSSVTFISCGTSKKSSSGGVLGGDTNVTGTVVKAVATVIGLILLSKLLKSVLGTIGSSTTFSSLSQNQQFTANFNENTPLSSIAKTDLMKTALQVLIAERYKIPFATVATNFNSLQTAGDLATFIGKNADAKVLTEINK